MMPGISWDHFVVVAVVVLATPLGLQDLSSPTRDCLGSETAES